MMSNDDSDSCDSDNYEQQGKEMLQTFSYAFSLAAKSVLLGHI
jgi:hypothetical protein